MSKGAVTHVSSLMPRASRSMRHMRLVQTLADHVDELLEIERLQDRIAHRLGRNLVDAAFSGGREDDDVRPVSVVLLPDAEPRCQGRGLEC